VKTASGARAVQIVHSQHRGSRDIEHIGSAHTDAELEVLKAAARQRIAGGQGELDLRLPDSPPAGGPLPITSSRMGHLLDALSAAYDRLGFDRATGRDEVFKALVLARIIEPTSKLDSLRVLEEAGAAVPSYRTVKRRLRLYAGEKPTETPGTTEKPNTTESDAQAAGDTGGQERPVGSHRTRSGAGPAGPGAGAIRDAGQCPAAHKGERARRCRRLSSRGRRLSSRGCAVAADVAEAHRGAADQPTGAGGRFPYAFAGQGYATTEPGEHLGDLRGVSLWRCQAAWG
jgi:hypothetical protein